MRDLDTSNDLNDGLESTSSSLFTEMRGQLQPRRQIPQTVNIGIEM